jgi:hypothetical protein
MQVFGQPISFCGLLLSIFLFFRAGLFDTSTFFSGNGLDFPPGDPC